MLPINFSKKGSGDTIILLHGFCENSNMWLHFQNVLAEKYTVYAIDLPGFGQSDALQKGFSLKDMAALIIDWAKEEEIEKACWIGHSLGGYVALAILDQAPEIVSGLGLFHSSAYADSEENKLKRDKALDFLDKHPIEKFIRPFVPSLFDSSQLQNLTSEIDKALQIGLQTTKDAAIGYTLAMKERRDHFSLWTHTDIPLLYIGGTGDSRIPVSVAEEHIESGHNVVGYILKNVGHMGMYEAPSHSLQIIKDFLLKVY